MATNVCKKCGNAMSLGNCSTCGLLEDLCVCAALGREGQKIKIWVEKRKFDKPMTIVEGIKENAKEVASQLKSKLATGGTYKHGHIELLGDHRNRIVKILVKLGYSEEQIEIS
ncbi:MAG TPA: stress response translation initiation inhibitor YciH [archaeon]|nr:stress response translation initiation inhibitor YciH [archaeon]